LLGRELEGNGIKIHIYESGNKNGETIVFLHPQGSTSKIWSKVLSFFEKDYHLVLMDLRGHGQSERAESGYDIQNQCKDILSVIECLQVEKVHFVGNSLGGDIATAFAAMYPDNVISLTNIDSGMIDYIGTEGERNITKEQVLSEFKCKEIKSFLTKADLIGYVQSVFPESIWDSYFEEWFKFVSIYEVEDGRIAYQIPTHINTQIMEMVCDLHYKDLYRTISCPILFLPAAKEEHLHTKLQYISEAARSTFTKTKIIPHSKHLMILNQFEEVCMEILHFFNEIKVNNLVG
jgi:2-succinyl-6-hydroxy-2,4-cyclohexadiene-1-carboxylate synthase